MPAAQLGSASGSRGDPGAAPLTSTAQKWDFIHSVTKKKGNVNGYQSSLDCNECAEGALRGIFT